MLSREKTLELVNNLANSLDKKIEESSGTFKVGITTCPYAHINTPMFFEHVENIEFINLIKDLRTLVMLCQTEVELKGILIKQLDICRDGKAYVNYSALIQMNSVMVHLKYKLSVRYEKFLNYLINTKE